MKLTGFELIEVRLPLRESFASSAEERRERSVLLLRAESDEGAEGWAECVAGEMPSYTAETTQTAWHVLSRFVLPRLVGAEILGPDDVTEGTAWIRGHRMALATAEMAVWDLQARDLGVPLWDLLGGAADPVPVGISLGIQAEVGALLERIAEALESGYRRVRLKIGPGADVEMVRAVRAEHPGLPLKVDANGAYTLEDLRVFEELDELGLELIEQPLPPDDLVAHAELQRLLETRVCLDESISSRGELAAAAALESCRAVSIKPGRVGGLAEARGMLEDCRQRGIGGSCGGMLETGIGRAHSLSFASLPGLTHWADLSASARYWERDLVFPPFELASDGSLSHAVGPGIGVEPDRTLIADLAVRSHTVGTLVRPVSSASP